MGMYTEVYVKVELIESVDKSIVDILKFMVSLTEDTPQDLPDHPLFKTSRWGFMLRCSSYYHIPKAINDLWYDDISNQWYLVSRSDLKNYEDEIELFFDWIKDYVDTDCGCKKFIGYSLYEESTEPTLYYAGSENEYTNWRQGE